MKRIVDLLVRYFGFWIIYFVVIRALFILYHCQPFSKEKFTDILKTFLYGMRMDLSMASYLSVLPFLGIGLLLFKVDSIKLSKLLAYYTLSLLIFISFLVVVDMELFSFWGYRLDGTPLKYLSTPGEVIASSLSSPWYLLIPILISLVVVSFLFYKKNVGFPLKAYNSEALRGKPVVNYIIILCIVGLFAIPIRGGLQQIPMNESTVYFSKSNLTNQAAVNLPWTFIHSLFEKSYSTTNPYEFADDVIANRFVNNVFQVHGNSTLSVVDTFKTNILIILWESFTSKADVDSVTPEFNKLKREGLFFNSIYASGDRSDKGIVAVLSGYPALSSTSIILNPNKSLKLPSLVKDFTKKGYNSSFYYGGELAFANMNSYLVQNKFSRLISKADFESKDMNSKWGVHDDVVLTRLKQELDTMKSPFFSMLFTLSSHEPFEIPIMAKYPGNDKTKMFLSSLNYTDKCLGDFISAAKKTSWWKNTIVIVIADHGHVLPGGHFATHWKEEFKIPMLWLGGALKVKDSVITKVASQSDLAVTLRAQFGIFGNDYPFSRNILSPSYKESAYYSFNNGFGYITPKGNYCYDNIANDYTYGAGELSSQMVQQGKAIQQVTFKDYLNK